MKYKSVHKPTNSKNLGRDSLQNSGMSVGFGFLPTDHRHRETVGVEASASTETSLVTGIKNFDTVRSDIHLTI